MIEKATSIKQTLQQRIGAMLENPSAGAAELADIIVETEQAIVEADETVTSERTKAADIIATPDADAAQQAISRAEAAKIDLSRLQSAIPKLRDRLAKALQSERRDRWLSDCRKVERQRNELAAQFNAAHDAYEPAKAAVDAVVNRMIDCNLDIERVNHMGADLQDWSNHLEPLQAPSRWLGTDKEEEERRWGPPRIVNGGLAVAMAQSMAPSAYSPADWSKPEYQAARRAAVEKQNREIGAYYAQAGKDQEARQNVEEREHFDAAHRRT